MANVKVRVLYPTAFMALGFDGDTDEASVPDDLAANLIAQGYAEPWKPAKAPAKDTK